MRYILISYDKSQVAVYRLNEGPPPKVEVQDTLCVGSSFGDVVKALEFAFQEEMKS